MLSKIAKEVSYFVYRNIHKGKGPDQHHYSLKNKKSGRVERRGQNFFLSDVAFKISDKGRARVLSEGRKNVHAGVEGKLTTEPSDVTEWQRVSYNPRIDQSFKDGFGRVIKSSPIVKLTPSGVFIPKSA